MNNGELRDQLLALFETCVGHKIKLSDDDLQALADEAPAFAHASTRSPIGIDLS